MGFFSRFHGVECRVAEITRHPYAEQQLQFSWYDWVSLIAADLWWLQEAGTLYA